MELCLIHRTIAADLRPVRNGGLSAPPRWGRFFWAVAIGYWPNWATRHSKRLASETQFNGVGRLRTYISFTHSAF
jgi:hypothetical protein